MKASFTICRCGNKSREIELCPYGCARLRMTEMPILK